MVAGNGLNLVFYLASHTVYRLWDELSLLSFTLIWWFVKCYTIVCVACCFIVVCRLSVMVLTFFTLIWRFVKRYTIVDIVCVACCLVVYGLSFIGCGINFLVKYILVCAECCLLTVAFHC